MNNKIIIAMDNSIEDGMKMIAKTCNLNGVYGYKIGSLWILDNGIDILNSVRNLLESKKSNCVIILDMQKWGTDIPSIVRKQVDKVAPFVEELIVCPMGGGHDSLEAFIEACNRQNIKPISVVKMTQPNADSYLNEASAQGIYLDSISAGCNSFVIPATKDPSDLDFINNAELYATGFKTQGGKTKPMVKFGVTRFIVGRAVYESENPLEVITEILAEINGETL